MTSTTASSHMKVHRALADAAFDRYVLATGEDALTPRTTALAVRALAPLGADPTTRKKAHWETRVHHNALALDPFAGDSFGAPAAYFVNASYQLVQVLQHPTRGLTLTSVYDLPQCATRQENASVQVAGKGLVVYCDGHGTLHAVAAERDPHGGATWREVYECAPWGVVPLLLVSASYDARHHRLYAVVAEPLSGNEADKAFRVAVVDILLEAASATQNDMEVDSADGGRDHVASSIAVVSKLPTHVSSSGPDVVMLVEGTYQLLMPHVAEKPERASVNVPPAATDASATPVCRRDEDDLSEGEIADLLSTVPRAGIGFHGDITKPKGPSELASVDSTMSLGERFRKSSTSFSSVATTLDAAPHASTRHNKASSSRTLDHACEVPTAESVLSGFEECDSGDPNARAALLRINCEQRTVRHQVDIDCLKFQFLCPSARVRGSNDHKSALLFRHDVHGLVFELDGTEARPTLRHTATLPAFGFVQASKQDKKFMSFHASGSFACIGEFQRRVFVYMGSSSDIEREAHTRKQHIVEFGDQELLGMQLVDEQTLFVLTSSQVYSLGLGSIERA